MVDEPVPSGQRLLEVRHVAHRLSVGPEYVWRLIRDGKLKAIRLDSRLRIDPADLDAFIDARRDEAAGPKLHAMPKGA